MGGDLSAAPRVRVISLSSFQRGRYDMSLAILCCSLLFPFQLVNSIILSDLLPSLSHLVKAMSHETALIYGGFKVRYPCLLKGDFLYVYVRSLSHKTIYSVRNTRFSVFSI